MTDPAITPDDGRRSDGTTAGVPSGAPARAGHGEVPVVALRNLSKSFGGALALDNIGIGHAQSLG